MTSPPQSTDRPPFVCQVCQRQYERYTTFDIFVESNRLPILVPNKRALLTHVLGIFFFDTKQIILRARHLVQEVLDISIEGPSKLVMPV
ncbi:hypothetical protein D0865_00785 [Hortaea werneckii]|uniref:Uncharacterized protein n=1 Tax=Hortaea werneckii TaxID=91943 RepID=A0A3M7DC09_HORWE|nr:hypothetical protein D0865_00785 [Hortaea werneckii]